MSLTFISKFGVPCDMATAILIALVVAGMVCLIKLNIDYWAARKNMTPDELAALKRVEAVESYWW